MFFGKGIGGGLSKKETCLRGRGRGRLAEIEPFYEPFYKYIIFI